MADGRRLWKAGLALAALLAMAGPASAQVLGGRLGGVGALPGGVLHSLPGTLDNTTQSLDNTLDNANAVLRDTVGRPLSAAHAFERDTNGARVVKGEVLAVAPSAAGLAAARQLNFASIRRETMPALGISVMVLQTPDGMSVTQALALLRKADPSGSYDYNHLYDPSGGDGSEASPGSGAAQTGAASIGMIDAGIDRRHPALSDADIETKSFAGRGEAPPTAHGTAIASLLVGDDGDFHGALSGTTLYAADVYGGSPDGGSADDIARALGWLAGKGVPVVNISLAGPPNLLLAAATAAFVARGHVLVAAVGNDGPAAPLRYPAGYPGVVGVTSVDAHRTIQLDACRGPDVAFAALGVDVRAAKPGGGYTRVTGTSFAAPEVAARFALLMDKPDPSLAARAFATLTREAVDLGPKGRDPIFGYGYLGAPAPSGLARRD